MMNSKQRGGTFLGIILGMMVGLAAALAVAIYVAKVPIPFVNKSPSRSSGQDAAEAEKNRDWDPNSPLRNRNAAKPGAPTAAGTVAPARQLFQIAPIGVLGLPRQPVLGPGRFDEARNRPRIGIAQRRQRMGQAAAVGGGQSSGRHGAQDSRRLPVSCAAMNAPPPPDSAAHAVPATATPPRPRALVGWRLLSLFYDLWPVAALWMLVAVPFVALDAFIAGDVRHNIAPGSLLSQLQFLCSLAVTGGYATLSWRRGGQTLGMRPWRLKLVTADGGTAGWKALWLRYLVGLLSLAAGGLGFWWAWIDRDRRTWHDRASGTHLVRLPKP